MVVAKRLRSEYVVGVRGVVQRRSDETINPKLATGEVEVLAREIRVLNEAKTPPFQIAGVVGIEPRNLT
jgi:aspartyl-tRNA synthetase